MTDQSTKTQALDRFNDHIDAVDGWGRGAVKDVSNAIARIDAALALAREQGYPASWLIRLYSRARAAEDDIEEAVKTLAIQIEMLNVHLIPEAFEREKVKTLTSIDGDRVTVSSRLFVSVPAETRSSAYQWLRDNGHGDLITETVNASTLSAFAKALVQEHGEELPDNLFKTTVIDQSSLTRGRRKPK